MESYIGVGPQESIMPGAGLNSEDSYRVLAWNHIGSVTMRKENEYAVLDIDFADQSNNKNTVIPDIINTQIASLAHCGVLMASKGEKL